MREKIKEEKRKEGKRRGKEESGRSMARKRRGKWEKMIRTEREEIGIPLHSLPILLHISPFK